MLKSEQFFFVTRNPQKKKGKLGFYADAPDQTLLSASELRPSPSSRILSFFISFSWIKHVCAAVGGRGGGRATTAQGGAEDLTKEDEAIRVARAFAAGKL